MTDDKDLAREPEPQPDPMLRERRLSPAWIWTIAIVCVALVVTILIAIGPPLTHTADVVNGRPGSVAPPTTGSQSAMPSGRSGSGGGTTPPVARPLTDERGNTTGSGNVAR